MPDTPSQGEQTGEHSAILLGLGSPRRSADSGPASASRLPHQVGRRPNFRDPVVSDAAWERIGPLIPERARRRRNPGRKPLDDRAVLNGILVVLGRRIGFEKLPQELEFGSGMTCWRRLRDWQQAGIWPEITKVLREEVPATRRIDFDRVVTAGTAEQDDEGRVARRPRSAALIRQPSPVAMEFGFTQLRRAR